MGQTSMNVSATAFKDTSKIVGNEKLRCNLEEKVSQSRNRVELFGSSNLVCI